MTSRKTGVQQRMLGAAVLKGTDVMFMSEERVGLSTAWCHSYRVGRALQRSTTPTSPD